jgi:hypothetical protein
LDDVASKKEAMYSPAHSKSIEETEEELISVIPGNKFVKFTNKFKYLGTYLAYDLSDDTNINKRILQLHKTPMP